MFLRKQKYQVTNVGVEKSKIQRNTTAKFRTVLTNSNCKLFLSLELTSYIQTADHSKRTGSPA